ncbi:uncharacterized protein LOC131231832 [Magnolia sinica]|uniref:uncharacterized protein LOC131231832 n=1 Tax=Magnolia sinica TaxID=86752 RepID=UPI0026598D4B|nr:uncharacterized protein LOC131231832 [Magnolia sinica]
MSTTTIQQRESGESIIVVLEGIKAAREEKGIAPLRWTFANFKNTNEILVLTILNPTVGSNKDFCCLSCPPNSPCEGEAHLKFLYQQISQRREMYRRNLRPFYDWCKNNGVKFEVKMAAGFQARTIMIKEANNVEATWIVMDRCLVDDESLRYHKEIRNLALVKDDNDVEVHHISPTTTTLIVPESPEHHLQSVPGPHILNSLDQQSPPSGSTHERNSIATDPVPGTSNVHENSPERRTVRLKVAAEVGWEEIMAITGGLQAWRCERGEFDLFKGFLCEPSGMKVMVKRFNGETDRVVEGEKRVAWLMSHRNILAPMGYHESSNGSALVYQYTGEGTLETLDQYMNRAFISQWRKFMRCAIISVV